MARKPVGAADAAPDEPARTKPHGRKRVLIKHYKVFTSIGRLIEGQREYLPVQEADALIAKGHAVEC